MNAHPRFQRLAQRDFENISQDADMREAYLDGLVLIDDLLCDFDTPRRHSRFTDHDIVSGLADVNSLLRPTIGATNVLQANALIARQLRDEAIRLRSNDEPVPAFETLVHRFLSDVSEAYADMVDAYRNP